jgi:hypothetical protein
MRRTFRGASALLAPIMLLAASAAQASFLSGDALDSFANGLSWFILIVMPPRGDRTVLDGARAAAEGGRKAPSSAERSDPHAVPVVAGLRRSVVPFAWLWAYTRPPSSR